MLSEVIVIGAGPGGVTCTQYLVRLGLDVTLVSSNVGGKQNHYRTIHGIGPFGPMQTADYLAELTKVLRSIEHAHPTKIRSISGKVSTVERTADKRYKVHIEDREAIGGKCVVVATGSSTNPAAIPTAIRSKVLTFEDYPFKTMGPLRRVLVLGAGFTAAEMVDHLATQGHSVLVVDIDHESYDRLPIERRNMFDHERCKVVFDKNYQLEDNEVRYTHGNGDERFEYDHVIACTGERVNTSFLPGELLNPENQRVTTVSGPASHQVCMSDKWEGLYAIGDIRDEELTSFIACAQADGIRVAQSIQRRLANEDCGT